MIVHFALTMPKDQTDMMMAKCDKAHGPEDIWENKSIVDAGVFFVFPGAYLGVLLDS